MAVWDVIDDFCQYDKRADGFAEDAERMRDLLANATTDRVWRRRGYLVVCRAHRERVLHACTGQTTPTRNQLTTAEASSEIGATGHYPFAAGYEWAAVVARVLSWEEEGVFRMIVGYL